MTSFDMTARTAQAITVAPSTFLRSSALQMGRTQVGRATSQRLAGNRGQAVLELRRAAQARFVALGSERMA